MSDIPDKPSMKKDPMVEQDKPANKINRGFLYGGILVVVVIVLLIAFNMSVKRSKATMNTTPGNDSSYLQTSPQDTAAVHDSSGY